jgi:hypothetical protein
MKNVASSQLLSYCYCRVGAIKSIMGELEKYKLDLVGVQEVRW